MAIPFTPLTFSNNMPSGYALDENFADIKSALQSALSREHSNDNEMKVDLDMNARRILNLPEPRDTSEAARLADVRAALGNSAANLISFTPYDFITEDDVQSAIEQTADKVNANETTLTATKDTVEDSTFGLNRRVLYVDTIADLQALPTSELVDGQAASVSTTERSGVFRYYDNSHDFTSEVSKDTAQGVYVSATSGGTFVRQIGQAVTYTPAIKVRWFGAKGDGDYDPATGSITGTDDTAAINAAAQFYRDFSRFIGVADTGNPNSDHGSSIYFDDGAYRCLGSLNFTTNDGDYSDGIKNVEFAGGAMILSQAVGKIAVDFSGVFNPRTTNLRVFGDPSNEPRIGVFLARTGTLTPNPSAGLAVMQSTKVWGSFSLAGVYNYGSEVNAWIGSEIRNKGGKCALYLTANNAAEAVTSDFCTIDTSYQSSYAGWFIGGSISWYGADSPGDSDGADVIIESMSYGPRFSDVYFNMNRTAVSPKTYFRIRDAQGIIGTSAKLQAPKIKGCVFEEGYDSIIQVVGRADELELEGCSFAGTADTADIVISSSGALYNPSIQATRGSVNVQPLTISNAGTLFKKKLSIVEKALPNTGWDFTESGLTLDGTWNSLDLTASDIGCPTNAKFASVKLEARNTTTISDAERFSLRGDSTTATSDHVDAQPYATGATTIVEGLVPVVNGAIEYKGPANLTRARILVRYFVI